MKSLLLSIAATFCFISAYAQIEYIATQSATKTLNAEGKVLSKTPFKRLAKNATIHLYNNYLTINFNTPLTQMESYKFARKVNVTDDDGGYTLWNATDNSGAVCEVMLKDYGTYSRIGIRYIARKYLILYQTL